MTEVSGVNPDPGYLGWAKDQLGVVLHHELRLSSTPGKEERGVFCEDDIPGDTIVVSVPWEVSNVDLCFVWERDSRKMTSRQP